MTRAQTRESLRMKIQLKFLQSKKSFLDLTFINGLILSDKDEDEDQYEGVEMEDFGIPRTPPEEIIETVRLF